MARHYPRPLPTPDDFAATTWDALCEARYKNRKDHWYRLIRTYAGYRTGNHALLKHMQTITDQWIEQHPTWRKARDRELEFGWLRM
jgi:hypothetical protein